MKYHWLLAALAFQLLLSSGCGVNFRLCNGTGEETVFVADGERHVVAPCDCVTATIAFRQTSRSVLIESSSGTVTTTVYLDGGSVLTFDGFEPSQTVMESDLTIKNTIHFRNQSSQSVHVIPERLTFGNDHYDFTFAQAPLTPGASRELATIRTGSESFGVYESRSPHARLGQCTAEVIDGLEVAWNGDELLCIVPPASEVDIDLCNEDIRPGAFPVILVTAEEDVLPEKNVLSGECRTVTVPIGASVSFEAWDSEAVLLLDECTLQGPSSGDRVVWDGVALTCVDVPPAATSTAATPELQPDPFGDMAVQAVRLGSDLTRSARRLIRNLMEAANPL